MSELQPVSSLSRPRWVVEAIPELLQFPRGERALYAFVVPATPATEHASLWDQWAGKK